MSASQKATGGRKTKTAKAPSARKGARGPKPKVVGEIHPSEGRISPASAAAGLARSDAPLLSTNLRPSGNEDHPPQRPPRGRSGGGSLPKPPQGHSGYERKIKRKLPRRAGSPPRYTNQNAKQQMLEAAIEAAADRGYEAMRISEVTDPIGVTRQAFYAHFRDKRHCMAEAIDPKLGAIERMAASLSESDPGSAAKIAHALDDAIAERFSSQEGTRGRIVSAMIELLRSEGSFHKVRIGALVKAAHVPPGDFYRQFSGKGECFAVAYEHLLEELVAEVRNSSGGSAEPRHEVPECSAEHTRYGVPALLTSLAEALNSDPDRRHVLIVEMAHLSDSAPEDVDGARKGALRSAIAELLAEAGALADHPHLVLAAASVVEVIRSAELAGDGGSLAPRLSGLGAGLMAGDPSGAAGGRPLAA